MMHYDFGDVVLIRFPFSDAQRAVQRPALVLYDNRDLDLVLCRITTRPCFSETDFKIVEWKQSGLLKPSYVRVSKVATLEKEMVNRKLGALNLSDSTDTKRILTAMFG